MGDKLLELPAGVRLMIAQKAHLDWMTRMYPVTDQGVWWDTGLEFTKNAMEWKRYQKLRAFKDDPIEHDKLATMFQTHYGRTFFEEWSKANGYSHFNTADERTDKVYSYRYADWICSQGMSMDLWDLLVSNGLWF